MKSFSFSKKYVILILQKSKALTFVKHKIFLIKEGVSKNAICCISIRNIIAFVPNY